MGTDYERLGATPEQAQRWSAERAAAQARESALLDSCDAEDVAAMVTEWAEARITSPQTRGAYFRHIADAMLAGAHKAQPTGHAEWLRGCAAGDTAVYVVISQDFHGRISDLEVMSAAPDFDLDGMKVRVANVDGGDSTPWRE
jgi:hypothetical protein